MKLYKQRKISNKIIFPTVVQSQDNNAGNTICLPNNQAHLSCEILSFHEQKKILELGEGEKWLPHVDTQVSFPLLQGYHPGRKHTAALSLDTSS